MRHHTSVLLVRSVSMKLRDKCQKHQEHYVKYVAKHDIHACQTNKAPLFSPDSVCCATCLGWPTFKHFQTIPNQHFSKALIRCIVWALLVGMDCQMLSLSLWILASICSIIVKISVFVRILVQCISARLQHGFGRGPLHCLQPSQAMLSQLLRRLDLSLD
jgi:hypothetical protein